MGKSSRNKGKRGERELAKYLRELGFEGARRGVQYQGGPDSPDVRGIDGVHIECKRTETLAIHAAMRQAADEAPENAVPIVCHKRSRQDWHVTLRLDHLEVLARRVLEELDGDRGR